MGEQERHSRRVGKKAQGLHVKPKPGRAGSDAPPAGVPPSHRHAAAGWKGLTIARMWEDYGLALRGLFTGVGSCADRITILRVRFCNFDRRDT